MATENLKAIEETLPITMKDCFKDMLKINPKQKISHNKEDFVIENFIDRVISKLKKHYASDESELLNITQGKYSKEIANYFWDNATDRT